MNAYERRRRERNLAAAARRKPAIEARRTEVLMQAAQLIKRYESAYLQYHKRPCVATYNAGWFTIHSRKVRAERLEEMIRNLEGLLHEQELNVPEEL